MSQSDEQQQQQQQHHQLGSSGDWLFCRVTGQTDWRERCGELAPSKWAGLEDGEGSTWHCWREKSIDAVTFSASSASSPLLSLQPSPTKLFAVGFYSQSTSPFVTVTYTTIVENSCQMAFAEL